MENAIIIENLEDLKIAQGYDLIYYGSENCENKIPSTNEILTLINKKIKFSLLTPLLTKKGFNKIKQILQIVPKYTEIIVNDFGLNNYINKHHPNMKQSVGRWIIHQFIKPGQNISFNNKECLKIIKSLNFSRIEISATTKNNKMNNLNIATSFYYPYTPITQTRRCMLGLNHYNTNQENYFSCNLECKNSLIEIKREFTNNQIFLQGNVEYIKNKLPTNTDTINRLVFQPLCEQDLSIKIKKI